jgi:hypothetical protein
MKSRSIKLAFLSAFVLTSPLLTFAGGQSAKVYTPAKDEARSSEGIARAVQQGKGSGMTRSQVVVRANAWRVETTDSPAPVQRPGTTGPNYNDTAFKK